MPQLLDACRVCDGSLFPLFTKKHLGKYDVRYFVCQACGGAQTEPPYWLEEAYSTFTFAKDTGMVQRTLQTARLALSLAYVCNFSREDLCIDIGGGTGLLTRYLRDFGLHAFWSDKYAQNIFAIGFEKDPSPEEKPCLITAFEVFEHFSHPQNELESLLRTHPEYLLFSTKLYQGQDHTWWYFLTDGQHVQFYSAKGLQTLAQRYGYHFQTDGSTFHLFHRPCLPQKIFTRLGKISREIEKKAAKRWDSRTQEDHLLAKR